MTVGASASHPLPFVGRAGEGKPDRASGARPPPPTPRPGGGGDLCLCGVRFRLGGAAGGPERPSPPLPLPEPPTSPTRGEGGSSAISLPPLWGRAGEGGALHAGRRRPGPNPTSGFPPPRGVGVGRGHPSQPSSCPGPPHPPREGGGRPSVPHGTASPRPPAQAAPASRTTLPPSHPAVPRPPSAGRLSPGLALEPPAIPAGGSFVRHRA